MGMFLSGHVQDGAHVMIDILIAGEPLIYEWEAFSFSLGSSLGDMYNAGAYVLVFLIGGFSGVWPYLKCTLLLYVVFERVEFHTFSKTLQEYHSYVSFIPPKKKATLECTLEFATNA